eukprot:1194866-Prorocentrum_minimum.AAC.1
MSNAEQMIEVNAESFVGTFEVECRKNPTSYVIKIVNIITNKYVTTNKTCRKRMQAVGGKRCVSLSVFSTRLCELLACVWIGSIARGLELGQCAEQQTTSRSFFLASDSIQARQVTYLHAPLSYFLAP